MIGGYFPCYNAHVFRLVLMLSSFAVAGAYEMRFDVYGRFELEVLRENNAWIAYRTGIGMRSRDSRVIIPASLALEEIAGYLDDLLHELCVPGRAIRAVP